MLSTIEKNNVKDVYEIISKHFSNTRAFSWSWINDFVNSLEKNSLILDIGCGNGRNMEFKNYNFIGIDNCDGFLNICREKKLNVLNANMTNIPLRSNTFDAIICIASFHHLSSNISRLNSLLEMKRLLKNNGKIMLSIWSINQPLKTKKVFKKYGNTIVTYNKVGEIYERYYYIFKIDEIKKLFIQSGLLLLKHNYDCGNEIFILSNF
jgi:ubiquinone/menaquinone biosynthesis C-methylase UbiE